jgi:hypothetical protein
MASNTKTRFFYHSFPRRFRNSDNEITAGCKILTSIRDYGLLLLPEIVSWQYPHADGSPPRRITSIQRRACFTELSPCELTKHSDEFGHFALEFPIDTLKSLGAIPVFYIPQATLGGAEEVSLGPTSVIQVIDAMLLVMRLVEIQKQLDTFPAITNDRMDREFGFQNRKVFSLNVAETRQHWKPYLIH